MKPALLALDDGVVGVEVRLAGGAGRVETPAPAGLDFGAVGAGQGEVAVEKR